MALTPVLTAHWDEADSYTIEGYRRHGGYEQVAQALRAWTRTRSSSWSRTPACAAAAVRASPPA